MVGWKGIYRESEKGFDTRNNCKIKVPVIISAGHCELSINFALGGEKMDQGGLTRLGDCACHCIVKKSKGKIKFNGR